MNYFSALPFREQGGQLGTCRFMEREEFHCTEKLPGWEIAVDDAIRNRPIEIIGRRL